MNLGRTIQDIRKARGIRQEDLAKECQITASYLSQIENNRKEPLLSTIRLIADKLGVPVPVLFFLAIDQEDIPEAKRSSFEILGPSMRAVIQQVFLSQPT